MPIFLLLVEVWSALAPKPQETACTTCAHQPDKHQLNHRVKPGCAHADELSQAELQQRLGVEGAVVTRIVKQLEAEGLITRRADPHDNHFTLVAPAGFSAAK